MNIHQAFNRPATEPVLCHGNDLAMVCADLRSRGLFPWAIDTGIGNNPAMYRVSYFERGDTPVNGSSSKDKQQASGNDPDKVANVPGLLLPDSGRARYAMARKSSGVCAEPATLNPFDGKACSTQAGHANTVGVGSAPMKNVSVSVVAVEHAVNSPSIEDRMAELQAKLVSSGQIKRSKPPTPTDHARNPYRDD